MDAELKQYLDEMGGRLKTHTSRELGKVEMRRIQRVENAPRKDDNRTMTDAQMMTLALAVIIPFSMSIYSNSRITEAKETHRAEMNSLRMEVRAGFEKLSSEIKDVRSDLKIHELEHHHK